MAILVATRSPSCVHPVKETVEKMDGEWLDDHHVYTKKKVYLKEVWAPFVPKYISTHLTRGKKQH